MHDARKLYVSVILPLRLEWLPCYYVPEQALSAGPVGRGDRVSVRFAGKTYHGVVAEADVTPDVDPEKILPVISVERTLAPVNPVELKLWKFVADYYLCTVGEVYKAAYPSLKITGEMSSARRAARRDALLSKRIALLEARIGKLVRSVSLKREMAEKARKGSTKERYVSEASRYEEQISALTEEKDRIEEELNGGARREIQIVLPENPGFALSAAQKEAYSRITENFAAGRPVLLDGVTGSGKTEIYMSLALDALRRGKNVLYLIPEIAVSRQMENRLRTVFGPLLRSFHSGMTAAARLEAANEIRSGRYVVLGTRSSLFLPHHDLGLIIVDEEQDVSYKQDSPAPRYNGRDTALMLARIENADAILGTATPSLESLYNCRAGKMSRVILSERYFGSENSEVEVIDTSAERRKRGMNGDFSFRLISDMRRVLGEGGQILILRARRAYAPAVQCSSCGDMPRCPHCNVPLGWHRQEGILMCHYCGWRKPYDGICAKCGAPLEPVGAGTQKIEEEVAALFPSARIARLDSDTAASAETAAHIIKDFAAGRIDILVGTQIIAKGFDFGGLSLVAVIGADSLMGQQDFRADERAVQILEQFRGRCGRRGKAGKLVIQTAYPDHPVYRVLADRRPESSVEDRNTLMEDMMMERSVFGYPPFSRIVRIIIKDRNEARADKMSLCLAAELRSVYGVVSAGFVQGNGGGVSVTGPYSPAVDKQSDLFIRGIRVSMKKDSMLGENKERLVAAVSGFETQRSYNGHIALDVDPV